MSTDAPRFLTYRTADHDEPILARGPKSGPQVFIIQPLFEEMNRCRAILVDVQRALASAGVGSALVDLPGTGESERALDRVSFGQWQQAVLDAAGVLGEEVHALGVRGGCLLDGVPIFRSRWRLSPVEGARLLKELDRAAVISGREDGLRSGYPIDDELAEGLGAAMIPMMTKTRTVRLASDPASADRHIDAPPPWRRTEPNRDRTLADDIAADVAAWIARCAA